MVAPPILIPVTADAPVNGILVSAGTTVNTYNNRIGDLRATAATVTAPASAIIGINLTSVAATSNQNVYYNTVFINATSSGTNFATTGIFHTASATATTATLDLRNNIIVNTSTAAGTGLTVAYRRSSTDLANYSANSNRNDFYASTIFTDGTVPNTFTAIIPYRAFVSTRDANAVSVTAPFLSTVSGNANFLKINPLTATQLESGAVNVSGITDDFEGTIRQGNAGYLAQVNGGGTAPDIGADEFDGTPAPVCQGTPASTTITGGTTPICSGTSGGTLGLSTTYSDLLITYQWKSGTVSGGPYNTTLGTSASQVVGNLTQTTYFVCTITCGNSGLSFTTAEKAIIVNPLPTVAVSPTTGTYCTPGGTAITLTASGASTYSWAGTGTPGLSATTGASITASPSTTTTITV